jgi:molecular chaperone DnaJ
MRLTGEGEPGAGGGIPGDLYVSVQVKKHPIFARNGYDILMEMPVNVAQAALGATVRVPTLEGDTELEIPAGTQHGQTFRLKGKGVFHLNGNRRGDHLVSMDIRTPKSLTEEQRRLFEELAASLPDQGAGEDQRDKGWFNKFKDALG